MKTLISRLPIVMYPVTLSFQSSFFSNIKSIGHKVCEKLPNTQITITQLHNKLRMGY